MQGRPHHVGPIGSECGEQARIWVAEFDVEAVFEQAVGNSAT
jgi:hypothetical protein